MRAALTALSFAGLSLFAAAPARADGAEDWLESWKDRLFAEINKARAAGTNCGGKWKGGVAPLSREETLGKVAQGHADDMRRRRYFSHISLDNQGPFERIAMNGYAYALAGETISGGVAEPAKVVAQWLQSPPSCEAVMNPKFRDVGLGLVFDRASRLRVWWVANFGKKAL